MRVRYVYGACTVRVRQRSVVASSMAQSFTLAIAEHRETPWYTLLTVPMRGAPMRLAQLLHCQRRKQQCGIQTSRQIKTGKSGPSYTQISQSSESSWL